MHCCTVLALLPDGAALSAGRLAEFHDVPPAYLAKQLQALAKAGIVESTTGPRGGYRLARTPADITLLDIVDAVEGGETAFRCTEIRQRGPAALPAREYKVACTITRAMHRAEEAWRAELASQTIADLVRQLSTDVSPKVAVKAAAWLQEVVR